MCFDSDRGRDRGGDRGGEEGRRESGKEGSTEGKRQRSSPAAITRVLKGHWMGTEAGANVNHIYCGRLQKRQARS